MATPPGNTIQVYTKTLKWLQDEEVNRRAGNFRRRNISRISRFWGYSWKFSPRNLGAWRSLVRQKWAIRENFLPRKFPAIRYHTYQSAVGDKPCQGNKLLNSKFKDPFAVTVTKGKLIVGGFPNKFHILLVDKVGLILCLWIRGSTAMCSDFSNISETNFRRKKFLRLGCSKAKISASQKFTVYDITTMQIYTDCDCCVLK